MENIEVLLVKYAILCIILQEKYQLYFIMECSYDYHFIIKGLAEEFEGDFECLGENKEKYTTFSVAIKKESNEDETIICRIKFIDRFRFTSTSLSTLVDNLSNKIIENGKCKYCDCCLDYIKIRKSGELIFKYFNCKRRYLKKIDNLELKKFKKSFRNTYNFCNKDINKFMLLLRKCVYPYEYMDDWDRFNEEKLPNKNDFHSSLNMEDISEIDYRHALKVFNKFNIKNLGEYHDLYVQSDTILLADVFESFRNLCLNTYGLDPAYFLALPGLAWQACLKHSGVKLELISDIDMLLMIEKGIRGGIYQSNFRNAKANNKYMIDYDEKEASSFLIYTDYNNLYGKSVSVKLPVDGFEWVEDISEIDENFIKNYDEDTNVGYFKEPDIEYPKKLHNEHSNLPFLPERMKVNKRKKLVCNLYDKKDYVDDIRSLKQALNNGLKIKKIHRVLKFKQRAWLKSYIDINKFKK